MHTHFTQPHRRKLRITVATVKTINGKPISEDQVDAWVAEAEKGYDIEFLRSRGSDPRDSIRSTTPEG